MLIFFSVPFKFIFFFKVERKATLWDNFDLSDRQMRSPKRTFYIFLSLIISVALIYLLISQISTQDLIFTLKNLYLPSLFTYMVISLSGASLRAWRYRLLLQPEGVSWSGILLVTFIKNSLIDLLPARLGSLSYIYLLNRRLGLAFEPVTSSFIASFLFDFLTLSPFLILAIMSVGLGVDAIASPAVLAIATLFFSSGHSCFYSDHSSGHSLLSNLSFFRHKI